MGSIPARQGMALVRHGGAGPKRRKEAIEVCAGTKRYSRLPSAGRRYSGQGAFHITGYPTLFLALSGARDKPLVHSAGGHDTIVPWLAAAIHNHNQSESA